jgi:hypothetical protein
MRARKTIQRLPAGPHQIHASAFKKYDTAARVWRRSEGRAWGLVSPRACRHGCAARHRRQHRVGAPASWMHRAHFNRVRRARAALRRRRVVGAPRPPGRREHVELALHLGDALALSIDRRPKRRHLQVLLLNTTRELLERRQWLAHGSESSDSVAHSAVPFCTRPTHSPGRSTAICYVMTHMALGNC